MRTRDLGLSGVCILSIALITLRWPRLEANTVSVTRSDVSVDEMVVEYRMPQPFEVGLAHRICKPYHWTEEPGIHLGGESSLRREAGEVIASTYDWIRGEYYVRLSFRRGSALVVDANGRHLEFPAWLAPDAGAYSGILRANASGWVTVSGTTSYPSLRRRSSMNT